MLWSYIAMAKVVRLLHRELQDSLGTTRIREVWTTDGIGQRRRDSAGN